MGWARLPVDGGAVNSRPGNSLEPGEFQATAGVRYAPGSKQLHSDVTWADTESQPQSAVLAGPFHLSFENTHDWLMLVYSTVLYFARADGTTAWTSSDTDIGLSDRVSSNGNASLAHWGDAYYLTTDHGIVEIMAPTGSGPPQPRRLGLRAPELSGMIQMVGTPATGAVTGLAGTVKESDLVTDDTYTYYITEYSTSSGFESQPIYYGYYNYALTIGEVDSQYEIHTILFPNAFFNDEADKFRLYFKYFDGPGSVSRATQELVPTTTYDAAVVGTTLVAKIDGTTEFDLAETYQNNIITKAAAQNGLPIIAADNARLIYSAYRHPNHARACAVWNDSLIMGDAGFAYGGGGDLDNRRAGEIPTIIRYSPPGDPSNQPIPYFMNFASERQDDIRGLIAVNDRLVVLCDNAVHSVRYLPFNNLLANQQGRVKDVVTTSVGCPSPNGFAKVETGSGEFVVWASHRGLEWSDGSGWADACPDFVMPQGEKQDTTQFYESAVLHNNAELYRLELYVGRFLYTFYYHPDHMKNGKLKMLGPELLDGYVTGACSYRDKAWRLENAVMKVSVAGGSPNDAFVATGHISGDSPYQDIEITDLGLTHGAVDGSIKLRADGAVRGQSLAVGVATGLPSPFLDETGSTGVGQRGNYIQVRMDIEDAVEPWAVGPMWIKGDEQVGSNG
jgi:hypothetical protein